MNTPHLSLLVLLVAVLLSACTAPSDQSSPKSRSETAAEAHDGEVPDNVRDPRPPMPPMGPLGMPMR